jgi:hypothetical protein
MAPRKPVESLYNLCVESVLKDVRKRKLCEDCTVLRKHLISYLPGTVRSYVVDKAVAKYSWVIKLELVILVVMIHSSIWFVIFYFSVNVRELSDLVALFGDQTTKRLNISEHYHMSSYESKNLFTIIDNSDIIGLHELDIKVRHCLFYSCGATAPYVFVCLYEYSPITRVKISFNSPCFKVLWTQLNISKVALSIFVTNSTGFAC